VTFFDAHHGANFTDLVEEMRGKVVLICDFSFEPTLFNQMVEVTDGRILVLDHHASAQTNFETIDPKYAVFDMKHSGAFITQVYVNGFLNVPRAVLYVEDNDIWKKELPSTLEFTAYMFLQPFEYESYVQLFDNEYVEKYAIPLGVGAVKQNQAHIDAILKKTQVSFMEMRGRYYMVPNVNCAGILRSELGNQAMMKFVHANFAMCYTQNLKYGSTSISLRSLDDRTDASYIAGQFRGGGHHNASGMGTNTLVTHMPGRVIDEYRAYDVLDYVYSREFNGKHVLMLNTPMMKTALAKYLLQERYVGTRDSGKNQDRYDLSLPGYQEGMFVMRNNLDQTNLDQVYSCSALWNYDGVKNRYYVTLSILSSLAEELTTVLDRCVVTYAMDEDEENVEDEVVQPFSYSQNKRTFYVSFNQQDTFRTVDEFICTVLQSL
jgi:oligoribonuclease NrnB/cAMP/cGMP phosphodiesterase (DHH superfamily)